MVAQQRLPDSGHLNLLFSLLLSFRVRLDFLAVLVQDFDLLDSNRLDTPHGSRPHPLAHLQDGDLGQALQPQYPLPPVALPEVFLATQPAILASLEASPLPEAQVHSVAISDQSSRILASRTSASVEVPFLQCP